MTNGKASICSSYEAGSKSDIPITSIGGIGHYLADFRAYPGGALYSDGFFSFDILGTFDLAVIRYKYSLRD